MHQKLLQLSPAFPLLISEISLGVANRQHLNVINAWNTGLNVCFLMMSPHASPRLWYCKGIPYSSFLHIDSPIWRHLSLMLLILDENYLRFVYGPIYATLRPRYFIIAFSDSVLRIFILNNIDHLLA
ncbi:hypothetical protein ARMSODRAFT_448439 [Armillaria solidipes]|uniref:Uncharacterized protein n=1 Tax=Armillaria solidipes TaxID=1076256 RepID=A0A2H3BK45_9AGAR|nr:hypothetical protein ARMSODRAFT_448439 [Armillaria solidipes]